MSKINQYEKAHTFIRLFYQNAKTLLPRYDNVELINFTHALRDLCTLSADTLTYSGNKGSYVYIIERKLNTINSDLQNLLITCKNDTDILHSLEKYNIAFTKIQELIEQITFGNDNNESQQVESLIDEFTVMQDILSPDTCKYFHPVEHAYRCELAKLNKKLLNDLDNTDDLMSYCVDANKHLTDISLEDAFDHGLDLYADRLWLDIIKREILEAVGIEGDSEW